jgi:hypothetical protein
MAVIMPPSSDESSQLLGLSRVTAHAEPVHGHHRGYADLYADVLRNQRMCLCGMLAAEYTTLPDAMQASVVSFFDQNEADASRLNGVSRRTGGIATCVKGCPRGTKCLTGPPIQTIEFAG